MKPLALNNRWEKLAADESIHVPWVTLERYATTAGRPGKECQR